MNKSQAEGKTYLVTGATSGLGLGTCKKLIEYGANRVIFAARNRAKAEKILDEIRTETKNGETVALEILELDTSTVAAGKIAAEKVVGPIDGVVLNAGGFGNPELKQDENGIETGIAINLTGNFALVEGLIASKKFNKGAHIVYISSEVTRGINAMNSPELKLDSEDETGIIEIIKGTYWEKENRKYEVMHQYGFAKLLGTLYVSALARNVDPNDELMVVSISPGATRGTNVMNELDMNPIQRFIMNNFMIYLISHSIEEGLDRYLAGLGLGYGSSDFPLENGHFYASAPDKMVGKYQDQGPLYPIFNNTELQDVTLKVIREQFGL